MNSKCEHFKSNYLNLCYEYQYSQDTLNISLKTVVYQKMTFITKWERHQRNRKSYAKTAIYYNK